MRSFQLGFLNASPAQVDAKNHVDRGDACGCFSKDPWDGPFTVELHDCFLRYESPYMNRAKEAFLPWW